MWHSLQQHQGHHMLRRRRRRRRRNTILRNKRFVLEPIAQAYDRTQSGNLSANEAAERLLPRSTQHGTIQHRTPLSPTKTKKRRTPLYENQTQIFTHEKLTKHARTHTHTHKQSNTHTHTHTHYNTDAHLEVTLAYAYIYI